MIEDLSTLLPEPWHLLSNRLFQVETSGGAVDWVAEKGERPGRDIYSSDTLRLKVHHAVNTAYGALTCRSTLQNTSDAEVVLTRIEPLRLHWEPNGETVYIRTCGGGLNQRFYPPETFRIETARADGHASVWMENGYDGRSSNWKLPLMTVCCDDVAVTAGLEWSGLWWMRGKGKGDGEAELSCHIPVNRLRLEPGEVLELPTAHYVFSRGGLDGASNAIRRYIRDRVTPGGTEPLKPSVSYNHWFGLGPDIDEDTLKARFDKAAELGISVAVLDAGWYGGCEDGNFQTGVGNWERVDSRKFPDGLEPLAARAADKGLDFGIWFEVERAHRTSDWAREHPEWYMDIGGDYLHLNLAIPEAVDACIRLVGDTVDRLKVKWLKLDYNIGPRPFWEAEDPTGKIQFAYMRGLYRFFDALREGRPDLVIENCASGGRRIDLGTIAHTHIQCLTDQTESPEVCRYTVLGANYFLPACVTPIGISFGTPERHPAHPERRLDRHELFSRLPGCMIVYGDIASLSEAESRLMKESIALHRDLTEVLNGDFTPLTPRPSVDTDSEVVQFTALNRASALLLAYPGHETGPHETTVVPTGLDPEADYRVMPIPHAKEQAAVRSGKDLLRDGIPIELKAKMCAGVLLESVRSRDRGLDRRGFQSGADPGGCGLRPSRAT